MQRHRHVGGQVLRQQAEPAPPHLAVLQELLPDAARHVHRNGKADADAATAAGNGGVDGDELALQVDEGAAGIAGIDGRVDLNEVLENLVADVGAHQRTHDPHGCGALQPERTADRDDDVPDLQVIGIAERHEWEVRGIDPQKRHVRSHVGPDQPGVENPAVGERDHDGGGVGDDMMVGDDQTAVRDR